jgi:hypothetical protein
MSETEFAAAIAPNVNGSSTIGVKKSTVCAIAVSPPAEEWIRRTAASSFVLVPTRRSPSPSVEGSRERTERRSS